MTDEPPAPPPPDAEPLDLLDLAVQQAVLAARWQSAYMAAPHQAPHLRNRILQIAVEWEEVARDTLNRVRVALGGEPYPDPSEPPAVRPDD